MTISASRYNVPYTTAFDTTGIVSPGAYLNFYATGSSTPVDTYTNADLSIANSNPVQANGAGLFPSIFLIPSQLYKVVLTDSNGDEIWTADPVSANFSSSSTAFSFPSTAALLNAFGAGFVLPNGIISLTAGRTAQGDGGGGPFYYDSSDTTSADNGGTIRVDGHGRRFKYLNLDFPHKNAVRTSLFDTLPHAVSATPSAGTLYIDNDWTLAADLNFGNLKVVGAGGVITLGTFTATGDFTADENVQIFNVNSTGHAAGVPGNLIYATWFGAGDGIDCTAAINGAIKYAKVNADGSKNRKVILPSGSLRISDQILTYDGVSVEGQGTEGTVILVLSTFAALTTSGAIRIGDNSTQVYGVRVSNMSLDLNNIASAIGCYTADAQDGTGFEHMIIKNVKDGKGVWINGDGGSIGFCNNYICRDIYVSKNNSASGGTAFQIDGGTLPGDVGNLTIVATGGGKFTYGYYFKDSVVIANSLSIDGSSVVTGVNISTGCLYTDIRGLTILTNNATGVNIESQNVPVMITSYFYNGGGNLLVDAGGGTATAKTIAGNGSFPIYARGQTILLNGVITLPGLQSSDPSVTGQLWGNVNVVTRSP